MDNTYNLKNILGKAKNPGYNLSHYERTGKIEGYGTSAVIQLGDWLVENLPNVTKSTIEDYHNSTYEIYFNVYYALKLEEFADNPDSKLEEDEIVIDDASKDIMELNVNIVTYSNKLRINLFDHTNNDRNLVMFVSREKDNILTEDFFKWVYSRILKAIDRYFIKLEDFVYWF